MLPRIKIEDGVIVSALKRLVVLKLWKGTINYRKSTTIRLILNRIFSCKSIFSLKK